MSEQNAAIMDHPQRGPDGRVGRVLPSHEVKNTEIGSPGAPSLADVAAVTSPGSIPEEAAAYLRVQEQLEKQQTSETPPKSVWKLPDKSDAVSVSERTLARAAAERHVRENHLLKLSDEERAAYVDHIEQVNLRALDYGAIRAKEFDSFGMYYQDAKAGNIADLKIAIKILQGFIVTAGSLKLLVRRANAESAHAMQVSILEHRAKIEVIQAAISAAEKDFGPAQALGEAVIASNQVEREETLEMFAHYEANGVDIGKEGEYLPLQKLAMRDHYARSPLSMPREPYTTIEEEPKEKNPFVKLVNPYI